MAIFLSAGSRFRFHGAGSSARRIRVAVLATAFLTVVSAAGAAPISFEQAVLLAEQRSAALTARQAAADGAQQARTAAGQLPDPQLAVGIENFPVSGPERFSWNRDSMTMRRVGLMQDVPNAAKRAAQREAAEAKTARERALLEAERLVVRREAALAWLGLHFAQLRLAVFAALEQESRVLQDTLAARLASGAAMPADALMARQEALELADVLRLVAVVSAGVQIPLELVRSEQALDVAAQLDFNPGSVCPGVGHHLLEVAHAAGERLHFAKAGVDQLQAFAHQL